MPTPPPRTDPAQPDLAQTNLARTDLAQIDPGQPDPGQTDPRYDDGSVPVSPSREDPVVAGASAFIGGPPGEHARLADRRSWWTPLRVLMALVVFTCLLGYAQKAPCRDTRNWTDHYQYTRFCYSDVVALYGQEGLADGKVPYLDYPTEYPPLIGAAMQVVAMFAGLAPQAEAVYRTDGGRQVLDHFTMDGRTSWFYDLTFVLFLVAAVVAVACTALTAGNRRVWDAALFAVAPALVLHLMTNWDILAVALASAGMLAWARRRPVLAGVLFGLAVVTKLYPLLFLVGLVVLCARSGQLRTWLRTAVATVATAATVVVPLWFLAGYFNGTDKVSAGILSRFLSGDSWTSMLFGGPDTARNGLARFFDLNSERQADWDSLAFAATWFAREYDVSAFSAVHGLIALVTAAVVAVACYSAVRDRGPMSPMIFVPPALAWLGVVGLSPTVLGKIRDDGISLGVLNAATAVALGAALLGVVALCWFAPRRPRVPQVFFLVVVAFLITNKVFSPQYTIWLLPLAALARPRWRMFLVWQLAEAGVMFTRFLHFVHNDTAGADGIDRGWFVGAVVLRDTVLCLLAALVVREILRPELDVVRASGVDDPAGGVLDGAPDSDGRWFGGPRAPEIDFGTRYDETGAADVGPGGTTGRTSTAVTPSAVVPTPSGQPPGSVFLPRRPVDGNRESDT